MRGTRQEPGPEARRTQNHPEDHLGTLVDTNIRKQAELTGCSDSSGLHPRGRHQEELLELRLCWEAGPAGAGGPREEGGQGGRCWTGGGSSVHPARRPPSSSFPSADERMIHPSRRPRASEQPAHARTHAREEAGSLCRASSVVASHLVDAELGSEVRLRPQVPHVLLHDPLHAQLLQAVGHVVEGVLVWKTGQSLGGTRRDERRAWRLPWQPRVVNPTADLVDQSHGEHQQLRVGALPLLQDLHDVTPGSHTCTGAEGAWSAVPR